MTLRKINTLHEYVFTLVLLTRKRATALETPFQKTLNRSLIILRFSTKIILPHATLPSNLKKQHCFSRTCLNHITPGTTHPMPWINFIIVSLNLFSLRYHLFDKQDIYVYWFFTFIWYIFGFSFSSTNHSCEFIRIFLNIFQWWTGTLNRVLTLEEHQRRNGISNAQG